MKDYKKIIVLSAVLLALIGLITLVLISDIDLKLFKTLSIASITKKAENVSDAVNKQTLAESTYKSTLTNLNAQKTNYDIQKSTYDNIDASTIEIVQDATKNEKYFIEYLWVVLGNYAKANDLGIDIIADGSSTGGTTNNATNGATAVTTTTGEQVPVSGTVVEPTTETNPLENVNGSSTTNNASTSQTATNTAQNSKVSTNTTTTPNTKNGNTAAEGANNSNSTSIANNSIRIVVTGRYSNVADFVFDVENDKELRFKLDNISMTYADNNKIQATFNILSLSVLK